MTIIKRILGLEAKKRSLEVQKENLKVQGKDTKDVGFNLAITNILLHSAKTNKKR